MTPTTTNSLSSSRSRRRRLASRSCVLRFFGAAPCGQQIKQARHDMAMVIIQSVLKDETTCPWPVLVFPCPFRLYNDADASGRPAVFRGLGWLCRCIDSLILLSIFVAFEFDRSLQKCASSFHSLTPSYAGTGAICDRIIGNGATSPVLLFHYQRLFYQKHERRTRITRGFASWSLEPGVPVITRDSFPNQFL